MLIENPLLGNTVICKAITKALVSDVGSSGKYGNDLLACRVSFLIDDPCLHLTWLWFVKLHHLKCIRGWVLGSFLATASGRMWNSVWESNFLSLGSITKLNKV